MAPPIKQQKLGKESEECDTPSNNLWVGNLSGETVDSDLMELFNKYGVLDSVATYSSRSFAFVFFKRVEDAKAAKEGLQGATLHGNQIKIEFARPAKPCKNLWVGGISQMISKEELEEEFRKFGKIEDFKFLRDRNTAFVEYFRMEDASQAMRSMNGKRIGGEQMRVDFLRSHPSRREQWPISHELRDGLFSGRMGPSDTHSMAKRPHPQLAGRKVDGQPSKVLWVGYPPSVQIDEQMLHNAMILFGEIERIKSFPSRHYAFVEFRSVEEARRAKEGLQGRLFNDPRITIMFSSSELAPGKDYSGFYSGIKGPRPDMLFSDHPFRPSQVDIFGQNHSGLSNIVSGPLTPSGIVGSNVPIRLFGHQGSYEPLLSGPEYSDLSVQDADPKILMGPNWRRPSPPLPSAQGFKPPMRQASGSWDVYDVSQFQRDAKRSRIEASLPIDDASFPLRKMDDLGSHSDDSYGLGPVNGGGALGPFVNVQGKGHLSPVPGKVVAGGPGVARSDNDYIWRGIIAKGGTPVCHARCVPIGKGLETELEDDFASYTEFLRYLGSKNRAGVAKFDDGTTLFLVPPSDFLTKVLKVVGPERLYGVVLKLPPQLPSTTLHAHPPLVSQSDYSFSHLKEEQGLQMEYGRDLHEESIPPARPLGQSAMQTQPLSNPTALSQTGVSLTPDLIATLASFLPTTSQTATVGGVQPPLVTSSSQLSFAQTIAPKGASAQIWNQDLQASEPATPSFQQFNPPAQLPPVQHYSISNTPIHSAQMALGSTQFQESAVSMPQHGAASSRQLTNINIPSQSEPGAVSAPISQQYQPEVPPNTQKGYGMMHGIDASGLYSAPTFQQQSNPNVLSNQVHGANVSQPQNVMQADKKILELPSQVQQLQSVLSGAGQGTSDVEADKNQRYQSTLQFAASLLLQIQQQQQQTNTPGGQGTGNQL
ncbi:flowering time control protein FPA-like isoform X2 [Durio zibethinus]|uniref:Flowering time control protein FPA-like isoform X2 n=1 Tax=Durio zibethinus TaxID=66656 RepID=A0A6P6AA12_DURZI|nr:flowering time control protein FPA-like isoform X2 [Durio zibethinus]